MNCLGHAVFTDSDADALFSSVTGDYIDIHHSDITAEMRKGLVMHAFLDKLPDTTPLLSHSRKHLHNLGTGYGNVILDICLDHVLASQWNNVFTTPLDIFTSQVYDIVTSRLHLLTPIGQERFRALINDKWLEKYATEEELKRAIKRLSRRVLERPKYSDRGRKILERIDDVVNLIPIISAEFISALPTIQAQVADRMNELDLRMEGRVLWKEGASFTESRRRGCEGQ